MADNILLTVILGVGFRGLSGPKAPIVLGTKIRKLYCLASSITL